MCVWRGEARCVLHHTRVSQCPSFQSEIFLWAFLGNTVHINLSVNILLTVSLCQLSCHLKYFFFVSLNRECAPIAITVSHVLHTSSFLQLFYSFLFFLLLVFFCFLLQCFDILYFISPLLHFSFSLELHNEEEKQVLEIFS